MTGDGRLRFQIVVDILVDAAELKDTCEEVGKPLLEVVQNLTEDFLAGSAGPCAALEYRLVRGPGLGDP